MRLALSPILPRRCEPRTTLACAAISLCFLSDCVCCVAAVRPDNALESARVHCDGLREGQAAFSLSTLQGGEYLLLELASSFSAASVVSAVSSCCDGAHCGVLLLVMRVQPSSTSPSTSFLELQSRLACLSIIVHGLRLWAVAQSATCFSAAL